MLRPRGGTRPSGAFRWVYATLEIGDISAVTSESSPGGNRLSDYPFKVSTKFKVSSGAPGRISRLSV